MTNEEAAIVLKLMLYNMPVPRGYNKSITTKLVYTEALCKAIDVLKKGEK